MMLLALTADEGPCAPARGSQADLPVHRVWKVIRCARWLITLYVPNYPTATYSNPRRPASE